MAETDAALAEALVGWFRQNGRDYPWRQTRDAYAILVSEVMLQQTQITTVLERGYYTRWLARFPDWQTLAAASESDVLKAWEGLGYYRRARNLQRLAQTVIAQHGGHFPRDPEQIRALPGVGPYTAGAVSSFAFGLKEPLVDGNVARVLSRLDADATPIDSTAGNKRLWARATQLVQTTDDTRALNSALMELGQVICRPTQPQCHICPVQPYCRAIEPETLPVKTRSIVLNEVTERVFFLRTEAGVLLEQETGPRRTGLWKLPTLPELDPLPPILLKAHYGITRYKVTLWVHELLSRPSEGSAAQRFIPLAELPTLAMPSPYRRALESLLKQQVFALEV